MNKNQKKLLGALVAVVAMSVVAAFGVAPGKAQADGEAASALFDGGLFRVLRHEEHAVGHEGAVILSVATNDDKSTYALAFMQTTGDYAGKGMACGVATKGDRSLRCLLDKGQDNVIEVLTVADLDTTYCDTLRREYDDAADSPNYVNPIMKLEDCKAKPCICYRIEYLKAGQAEAGASGTTVAFNPPGRGSGSGGTD